MKTTALLLFLFLRFVSFSQSQPHTTEPNDSPVKVDSYNFVPVNGTPGHLEIKFTNVSGKKIKQIRFTWKQTSAQGDSLKTGDGDITDSYKPNKHATAVFAIINGKVSKVSAVFPYEVVYIDNTTWKLIDYQRNVIQ